MPVHTRSFILTLFLTAAAFQAASAERVLFYEKVDEKKTLTFTLRFDGDQVRGSETWQPREQDGARGDLDGKLKGDRVTAIYHHMIEGSDQTQEQVFRLLKDTLLVGSGKLTDPKDDGNLVLVDPEQLTFETRLKRVTPMEPPVGSRERKALMDAMRGPVSRQVGQAVEFTGNLLVHDGWARFQGNVGTKSGKPPADEEIAMNLELDFFALLQIDEAGEWIVKSMGFSGDIGAREEARKHFPKASWVLFE